MSQILRCDSCRGDITEKPWRVFPDYEPPNMETMIKWQRGEVQMCYDFCSASCVGLWASMVDALKGATEA